MDKEPLVSVLMTAYNREKFIAESIESVLKSTYTNFELIVVDDGSTDNTLSIARKYESLDKRVKVYKNEKNLGDYPNRNKAASYASGKYIKYLDSDDLIYEHGLEVFVRSMEANPTAALGLTSRNPLPLTPFPILLQPLEAYRKHFFIAGILDFGPSGSIVRKDIFDKMGGFSGKRYVGDFELWLSIAALYPIVEVSSALVFWRQHEGQEFSQGLSDLQSGYYALELPLVEEKLMHKDCPLSPEDAKKILRKKRKAISRFLLKYSLRTRHFSQAYRTANKLKLNLHDLF
jgi:glycosyltransferase involved in cell wall biosynthesis